MTKAAAISAAYADFRLVKSRKVVQLVFEVPLEKANEAISVLGGMPDPSAEIWVALARLQPTPIKQEERPKRTFNEMSLAAQAGMMCQDGRFQKFVSERYDAQDTAEFVRAYCNVSSRADIKPGCDAGHLWGILVSLYHTWLQEPAAGVA